MRIKKVFLIYPPTGLYMRDDRCQAPVKGMTAQPMRTPLDLAYMAATLERAGVKCMIKDYPAEGKEWMDFEYDLKLFGPDMLIISVTTPTMVADLKACTIAKRFSGNILVMSKGAHYLAEAGDVLNRYPDLDIVIRGESELAVAEIATASDLKNVPGITYRKDGSVLHNADRPFLGDLDSLPFPARHLLNNGLYLTPDTKEPITMLYTGRGCPHRCVFCAVPLVSGHVIKLRSPRSIVDEIQECVERYGIRNFFFRADTFTWNEGWVIKICRLIIDRGLSIRWGTNSRVDTISNARVEWMKKAGCWIIGFGVESGSRRSLDLMKKRVTTEDAVKAVSVCKRYGIKTYALFVIGFPWEDRNSVGETMRFARLLNSDYIDINICYPIPGTELFDVAKKESLFKEKEIHGYDYTRPLIKTRYLSTEDLIALRRKGLLLFYLRPGYILKTFLSIRSAREFSSYVKAGLSLMPNLFNNESNVDESRRG